MSETAYGQEADIKGDTPTPVTQTATTQPTATVADNTAVANDNASSIPLADRDEVNELMMEHVRKAISDTSRLVVTEPGDFLGVDQDQGLPKMRPGPLMAHILKELTPALINDENPQAPTVLEMFRQHNVFGTGNLSPSAVAVPSGMDSQPDPYLSIVLFPEATSIHYIEQTTAGVMDPSVVFISPYASKYMELFVALHEFGHTMDLGIHPVDQEDEDLTRFREAVADCYAMLAFEQLREKYPDSLPNSEGLILRQNAERQIGILQTLIRSGGVIHEEQTNPFTGETRLQTNISHFTSPFLPEFNDVIEKARADGTLATMTPEQMLEIAREHVKEKAAELPLDNIIALNDTLGRYWEPLSKTDFYDRADAIKQHILPNLDPNKAEDKLAIDMLNDYIHGVELIRAAQPKDPQARFEAWKKAVLQEAEGAPDRALALAMENLFIAQQLAYMNSHDTDVKEMRAILQGFGGDKDKIDIPMHLRMSFIAEEMAKLAAEAAPAPTEPDAKAEQEIAVQPANDGVANLENPPVVITRPVTPPTPPAP